MSFVHIPKTTRRELLRGLVGGGAVSVALPFLDCFLNNSGTALASGAPLPVRFGTWYWGLGLTPKYAVVEKTNTTHGIDFLEQCKALIPHKDYINYYGQFNMPLDGRSNYTHYSGWVTTRTGTAPQGATDIPAPTLDYLIADNNPAATRFETLDMTAVGIPRENYTGRNTNSRAAAEPSPLALYQRVFGPDFADPNKADFKPNPRVMVRQSVLSAVAEQSKSFANTLGASDRARLDEYFTSIRQLENQISLQLQAPPPNEACVIPHMAVVDGVAPTSGGLDAETVTANHDIMAKIIAMAAACNQTKVFNMAYSDNYSHIRKAGETYTHHICTHEETVDDKLGYQPVTYWFTTRSMNAFGEFISAFRNIKEGDGTLLDNTLIFANSETNYARLHSIDGAPMFTAGRAGGKMKTGYHVVGNGDPVTRVGYTAMRAMGLPLDKWGTKSLQTSKAITEVLA
jgi:hypothetical protein